MPPFQIPEYATGFILFYLFEETAKSMLKPLTCCTVNNTKDVLNSKHSCAPQAQFAFVIDR